MTDDSFSAQLSDINNLLESAHVKLGDIYRKYGVADGEPLAIDANDVQAHAAIEAMRSANARLNEFLSRLPSYD